MNQDLLEYLSQVATRMGRTLSLDDALGRDQLDQELTADLAYLAEQESNLVGKVGELSKIHAGSSVAATKMALEATSEYAQLVYVRKLTDAIIEKIRGLRSHSKRQYEERIINEHQ